MCSGGDAASRYRYCIAPRLPYRFRKEKIIFESAGGGTVAELERGVGRSCRDEVRETTRTVARCTRWILVVAAQQLV